MRGHLPSVVFHGHFYQPPREDPWIDRVLHEPSATPYCDWNHRTLAECYRPVTEARLLDGSGRIRGILNTLEFMSWDAGPTLLRWLAREAPGTYAAFLEADARSRARLRFGNAMASPYHHMILPLASRRDKVTEVRWGIEDFRRRFGRAPEGLWLPETAVDLETLDVLVREGIAFTVLAPGQVDCVPPGGGPARVRLGRGRSIAVFVYDGPLSHGVAFGSLLGSAEGWIRRVSEIAASPGHDLLSLAADGETFGHHHPWSDMALAATLEGLEGRRDLRLENFASYLDRHPPRKDVELIEPSSWSCAHGVERWRSECGCRAAPEHQSQQAWRGPLRAALETLAGGIHEVFEREAGRAFDDVWQVRDDFGSTLDRGTSAQRTFVRSQAGTPLEDGEVERLLDLLEAERESLRMFTSCGWFFDDLAGLETLQLLRFAARAIDLVGDPELEMEERLQSDLAAGRSNDPEEGDGRRIWERRIRMPSASPIWPGGSPVSELLRGTPAEGELTASVRRFLRAPGPEAAHGVIALATSIGAVDPRQLIAAQSLLARGIVREEGEADATIMEVARSLGFGDGMLTPRSTGGVGPIRFVFGLHLHQPVGNFDEVFRTHADRVYLPLLERLSDHGVLPLTLHVSGPLLEWLSAAAHPLLDRIGTLASAGDVELLLSGFHEPVLPALAREERVEQIRWMKEWIESRFGVEASGLWLTERVWEPDLVEDLVRAEVRYTLVDDRHFLTAGLPPHVLHRPHRTESGGRSLTLLPIDEKLRYLVPFRPVEELEAYLRSLRAEDHPLAILADDGEKFGGWPGTAAWVWESGWLDAFVGTMRRLVEDGVVELSRAGDAVDEVAPLGPSYLPSGSYREMEGWSLPASATVALEAAEQALEAAGAPAATSRFLRGGHWRNFLAVYPESGRMHRKAQLLSALARERGAPEEVRRILGRARCNDPYWHGVFGGLYLRHLRGAIWASLAEAEERLRGEEGLSIERVRGASEGGEELWVHSRHFSSLVNPSLGGAIVELTHFADRANLADVLTRRWESYHRSWAPNAPGHEGAHVPGAEQRGDPVEGGTDLGGMPSIHDLEARLGVAELPPFDREDRTLTVERVLPGHLSPEAYTQADYDPIRSWSLERPEYAWNEARGEVEVAFVFSGRGSLEKSIRWTESGSVTLEYRWDPVDFPPDALFAPEFSLAREVPIETDPEPAGVWKYEIRTVSKSESGAEESVQGVSVTPFWPSEAGRARVHLCVGSDVRDRPVRGKDVPEA